jgi:hypothetical protein
VFLRIQTSINKPHGGKITRESKWLAVTDLSLAHQPKLRTVGYLPQNVAWVRSTLFQDLLTESRLLLCIYLELGFSPELGSSCPIRHRVLVRPKPLPLPTSAASTFHPPFPPSASNPVAKSTTPGHPSLGPDTPPILMDLAILHKHPASPLSEDSPAHYLCPRTSLVGWSGFYSLT